MPIKIETLRDRVPVKRTSGLNVNRAVIHERFFAKISELYFNLVQYDTVPLTPYYEDSILSDVMAKPPSGFGPRLKAKALHHNCHERGI